MPRLLIALAVSISSGLLSPALADESLYPLLWPKDADGQPLPLPSPDAVVERSAATERSADADPVERIIQRLEDCIVDDRRQCRADGTMDGASLRMLTDACPASPGACTAVGLAYDLGVQVSQDEERAAASYQMACDGEDARGCRHLGANLLASDPKAASKLFDQACRAGNQGGCADLALSFYYGDGVNQDVTQAVRLLVEACGQGSWKGCESLAIVQGNIETDDDLWWTQRELNASLNGLLLAGCQDRAYYSSCVELGFRIENGFYDLEPDTDTALGLYGLACAEGGVNEACELRGNLLVTSGRMPQQEAEVVLPEIAAPEPADVERAIEEAQFQPLGSDRNPVRVNGVAGQQMYLSYLRCSDGLPPRILGRGSRIGTFGNFDDIYQLDCGSALPGQVPLYMDLYHPRFETRAAYGFALDPFCELVPENADLSSFRDNTNAIQIRVTCRDRRDLVLPPPGG